jgi:hypothetical protein
MGISVCVYNLLLVCCTCNNLFSRHNTSHFFPAVPPVEACLADAYLSVFLELFKGCFIVTPGDAVEDILCPFFLVNDAFLQLPIREL